MEQKSNATRSQSITASSFRHWRYMRFIFILVSGFTLTNMGARAIAQLSLPTVTLSSPFLQYADIFPGQSSDALDSRRFSCIDVYRNYLSAEISCAVTFSSGIFSEIAVTIGNGFIKSTTFIMREDTFKIGDLVLLLGNPKYHAYPRKIFFFWKNLFVIVSTRASGNHPSMRPVWSVTFTDRY